MSIPLIEEDSNKASSTKNNLSKSMESKPGLAQEEVMNIQCVKKKIGLCFFYNNFIETASILTWNGLFEN